MTEPQEDPPRRTKSSALRDRITGDDKDDTGDKDDKKKPDPVQTFRQLLVRSKDQIAAALPRHLTEERMTRLALTCFRTNPGLWKCDPSSVIAAIMQASQLGLEPGLTDECALVPFGGECQLIPMYPGLIKLATNTGRIGPINAHVVYRHDKFDLVFGTKTVLQHRPELDGERGEMRLVYGTAQMAGAKEPLIDFMTRSEVHAIRDASKGYQKALREGKSTPWVVNEAEMWRKTMLRRLCKKLPRSVELQAALELDRLATLENQSQGITIDAVAEGQWMLPNHNEDGT